MSGSKTVNVGLSQNYSVHFHQNEGRYSDDVTLDQEISFEYICMDEGEVVVLMFQHRHSLSYPLCFLFDFIFICVPVKQFVMLFLTKQFAKVNSDLRQWKKTYWNLLYQLHHVITHLIILTVAEFDHKCEQYLLIDFIYCPCKCEFAEVALEVGVQANESILNLI